LTIAHTEIIAAACGGQQLYWNDMLAGGTKSAPRWMGKEPIKNYRPDGYQPLSSHTRRSYRHILFNLFRQFFKILFNIVYQFNRFPKNVNFFLQFLFLNFLH